MIVAEVTGAEVVAQDLMAAGARIRGGVGTVVRKQAEYLKNAVIEEANSRFNVEDYDSTIHITSGAWTGDLNDAEVYSSSNHSHRLEMGFMGTDSIGRTYHQPPRPHFAPAAARTEENFYHDMAAMVGFATT